MTKKNESFNFLPWVVGSLAIVAILFIIRSTNQEITETATEVLTEEINDVKDTMVVESIENEVPAISFLRLEKDEVDSLPKELIDLYGKITTTRNYASGLSIFPSMKSLNDLINKEFEKYSLEPVEDEDELLESMEGLKVNTRVTADHFNKGGRMILNKMFLLQEKAYPKLANQLREIKSALSDTPPSGSLQGYSHKVKEFFDECFVFFYLAWEEESKTEA